MSDPGRRTTERDAKLKRAQSQALLQVWFSPAFPVGAFAYSHGLEAAVDHGWIKNRNTLEFWLAELVAHGALQNDLILLAAAWRSADASDATQVRDIAELGTALQPSAERHLEATQQGRSFVDAVAAAWPPEVPSLLRDLGQHDITYPVSVGTAAALHEIPLPDVLRAYAVGFLSNLTSAAIRLSIVGQTDAQLILAALMPDLIASAERAETASLDDIGSATLRSDLASMLHETQYSRLFRS
ncbi:urease accessory protein UreF [Leptospira interrogans]